MLSSILQHLEEAFLLICSNDHPTPVDGPVPADPALYCVTLCELQGQPARSFNPTAGDLLQPCLQD